LSAVLRQCRWERGHLARMCDGGMASGYKSCGIGRSTPKRLAAHQ